MTPGQMRALVMMAPDEFTEFERGMQTARRLRREVAATLAHQRQMDVATRGLHGERLRRVECELRQSYARCGFAGPDIERRIQQQVYG